MAMVWFVGCRGRACLLTMSLPNGANREGRRRYVDFAGFGVVAVFASKAPTGGEQGRRRVGCVFIWEVLLEDTVSVK
ncbi:Unannotated [Lentimonas sp. CC19]|nr:Unannotated [Lentimonas sp. CC10]CAA6695560.1 Unannotated [Lentimonas sp. CC19]CAA7069891.1 Unannotated [Lentimonas sp. CC11]